jgi:hypothetical protein
MNCSCSLEGLQCLIGLKSPCCSGLDRGDEAVLASKQGNFVVLWKGGLVALDNCSEKRMKNELWNLSLIWMSYKIFNFFFLLLHENMHDLF